MPLYSGRFCDECVIAWETDVKWCPNCGSDYIHSYSRYNKNTIYHIVMWRPPVGVRYAKEEVQKEKFEDLKRAILDLKAENLSGDFVRRTRKWKRKIGKDRMRIDKEWGYEVVLVNNDKYCMKRLCFFRNACTSMHRHEKKDETFSVHWVPEGDISVFREGQIWKIKPDEQIRIYPGEWHSVHCAVNPQVVMEVSTHHDDEDVERWPSMHSSRGLPYAKWEELCKKTWEEMS